VQYLDAIDLSHKKVILREDFNVPLQDGRIRDTTRIDRALPTLNKLLAARSKVLILSHLGRPQGVDDTLSLAPVAAYLSQVLQTEVKLLRDWPGVIDWGDSEIVLAENVRFLSGEMTNDGALAKAMAQGFDVFVMDAFACAHRAHASTVGICSHVPICCAGPLLQQEVAAIDAALLRPKRPVVGIIGGAKVSTKIHLLEQLLSEVDCLIVGGGIANTFIKASGAPIGASLHESSYVEKAEQLLRQYGDKIPLPTDVITAASLTTVPCQKDLASVVDADSIFDIGEKTRCHYAKLLKTAGTIIWNGPVGVFEYDAFAQGTRAVAAAVTDSTAYSLVGGGDTIAALNQFGLMDKVSTVSTGGGAFLSYLKDRTLPGIQALNKE
jgi:phosphoglycerate kinase